jgi:hypothetical protein
MDAVKKREFPILVVRLFARIYIYIYSEVYISTENN